MTRYPTKGGSLYAVYGADGQEMAKQLLLAGDVAASIPAGADIALKPNLVVSRPASGGATTHPEILAGIIEYLVDHGHTRIDIIESAWVGDDTEKAFAVCGIRDLQSRYGVRLHDLKKDSFTPVDTSAGTIRVCDRARKAGFLINVPVLKGHCQTRVTCALKNMKGCIPDTEKRRFHRDGLDECIAALAAAIVPHVTVADGLCGDLDFEEGGNPVTANRMLLAGDPVKLDSEACRIMGISPEEIPYLGLAERYGVGEISRLPGDLVELNQPDAAAEMPKPSGKVARLAKHIDDRQACSACYANLIHALKRLDEDAALPSNLRAAIGQGWKGKRCGAFGVGACAAGADSHIPGCPPSALDIVRALRDS